ncbi:MAG: hypothetical protein JOZ08_13515 [Verrucomicrobia bacterium]|nr:hypothetical protein [Verrucomicrobiota bacterium]
MLIFGNSQKYPDDSEESFIVENLPAYCVLWLTRQSEALGETRMVIFERILKEWFAIHVRDVPKNLDAYIAEIAREAVSEFIIRHRDEFLPVNGDGEVVE